MPLFNKLTTLRVIKMIRIDITNNEPTPYTNAPVFADIPTSLVQELGCGLNEMRLVDENSNPVTFWPEAGGAEVFTGYHTIWFKTDLPASGTRTFRLICSPGAPSATNNPTDVVNAYFDLSDLNQLYYRNNAAELDYNKYVDPPASVDIYPLSYAINDTSSSRYYSIGFSIPMGPRLIFKYSWSLRDVASGFIFTAEVRYGNSYYTHGPRLWYGGTAAYNFGTNIGYQQSSYVVLGTYNPDSQWHRVLVFVDSINRNAALLYDTQLYEDIPFYQTSSYWDDASEYIVYTNTYKPSSQQNLSDPHADAAVAVLVPYTKLPSSQVTLEQHLDYSCIGRPIETY